MRNKQEILDKINELKKSREQTEIDYKDMYNNNNQDIQEQLIYVEIDMDILSQKINLLEWVLN